MRPRETPRTALRAFGYVSAPTVAFSDRDLADLLDSARRFNAQHDVTGELVVLKDETGVVRFAQVIEGPPEGVAAVRARIEADPRHDDLRTVLRTPIAERRFADWSMDVVLVERPLAFERETAVLLGYTRPGPSESALGAAARRSARAAAAGPPAMLRR